MTEAVLSHVTATWQFLHGASAKKQVGIDVCKNNVIYVQILYS
jgi:hypothetical protein